MRFGDGGWIQLIGNHVVLDLVNTVSWRLAPARKVDRLTDGLTVVRWAHFAGIVGDERAGVFAEAVTGDQELSTAIAGQVRDLRERLYRVLRPAATGEQPSCDDVDGLRDLLLEALRQAEMVSVMPLRWRMPMRTVGDVPRELVLSAWQLLEHGNPGRLRQCQDEACGWLFMDRSKNASRVWCSSADCGNRQRARRHYREHATVAPSSRVEGRQPRESAGGDRR
jgi:predicted RNA-binding Zn ribbon-like protein